MLNKSLREQAPDGVESTLNIPLLFSVETHVEERCNVGWKDCTAKDLYLGLRATVENYAAMRGSGEFRSHGS